MDLKKYIYGHCVNPVRVRIWDSLSNSYVVKEVPCGKCLHCRTTKVNQWVTRLYAQAKYSKYVYYITLDYAPFDLSSSVGQSLAIDTAATYHDLNFTKSYGLHPILLRKTHLQNFFKRLRKNTGVKIQYFACGEYGTHANGRGFGRPHFHAIIFSNTPISKDDFQSAWTIDGYKIGNVDYHNLMENGTFLKNVYNNGYTPLYVFKYVCKYLQKGNFDFDKLATIDFHRAYFKSTQYMLTKTDTLFPESEPITDSKLLQYNWEQYIKDYSPFCVCSRRPSIGYAYFEENASRFQNRDFKLFGLPDECVAFPYYYYRKTKEGLFYFRAVGDVSQLPTTSNRIGAILSVLSSVASSRTSFSNFESLFADTWCSGKYAKSNGIVSDVVRDSDFVHIVNGSLSAIVPNHHLHMYDSLNKVFYQFDTYGYKLWQKTKLGYSYITYMDIIDVIRFLEKPYKDYLRDFISAEHDVSVLREKDLYDSISVQYKGDTFDDKYAQFKRDVYTYYENEIKSQFNYFMRTKNSKITF